MKHLLFTITIFALLLFTTVAHAEYKIATVDVNRILNESSESQSAKKQLDSQAKAARQDIERKRASLKKKEESLIAKKAKPDSAEAEAFRKEAKELARTMKDSEEELRAKFAKVNNKLTKEALTLVEAYAKENGIDLVLDKGAPGRSAVLFGTPTVDITEQIISKMKG